MLTPAKVAHLSPLQHNLKMGEMKKEKCPHMKTIHKSSGCQHTSTHWAIVLKLTFQTL